MDWADHWAAVTAHVITWGGGPISGQYRFADERCTDLSRVLQPRCCCRMLLRCPHHGLTTLPFLARGRSTGSLVKAGGPHRGRLCREQLLRLHASSADVASSIEADNGAGPRCWLEPAEDGNYDVVCVTDGPTFIGAAESDYGFSDAKGGLSWDPSSSPPATV